MNTPFFLFLTFLALVANMTLAIPANPDKVFTTFTSGVVNSGVEGTLTEATMAPEKTGGGIDYNIEDIPLGPEFMTFTVVNKHTANISTTHVVGAGAPTAVSGPVGAGTMVSSFWTQFKHSKEQTSPIRGLVPPPPLIFEQSSLLGALIADC